MITIQTTKVEINTIYDQDGERVLTQVIAWGKMHRRGKPHVYQWYRTDKHRCEIRHDGVVVHGAVRSIFYRGRVVITHCNRKYDPEVLDRYWVRWEDRFNIPVGHTPK